MIVDSHQHFWKYEAQKHAWIDDAMAAIRRDFYPEDLQQVYRAHAIDGCVAVQADQTLEETYFLVDLAANYEFIKGVVGWVDLRDPFIDKTLESLSQFKIIKGFRHVVQGEPDPNFLLRNDFLRGIKALNRFDFTYDILVFPHQLGAVLEFVRKFPNHKFVIDHMAKPYIKDGFFDGWANQMRAIGACDHVHCKISGLVTEADYTAWTPQHMQPYLDLVLEAFGPEKLMFGSDWPVCLVAGNYSQVKSLAANFIAKLSDKEQAQIMGLNAVNFYNL